MIILIDFDGTIVEQKYPDIGLPKIKTIKWIKERKSLGDKFILYTCRAGKELQEAVEYCRSLGIEFDAVNDDLPEVKLTEFGKNKSNKIFRHLCLDDRNITLKEIGE